MQLAGEVEFLAARKLHLLLSFEVVEHGLHDVEHLLPIHLALRFMNFQSHEEGRRTNTSRHVLSRQVRDAHRHLIVVTARDANHVGVAVDSASIQLPSFAHVGAPPERQIETKAAVAGVQNTGESHSFWQRRHQKPVDLVVDD